MHDKIKEFLDAKKAEERRKFEESKQKTLIELGLFEKEYAPELGEYNPIEYNEWDATTCKWYKKTGYISVTDEEYEEIKKYSKKDETSLSNPVAIALTVIAWIIFIGGFIAGIAFGTVEVTRGVYYTYTYTDTEFSFKIALIYWCASFISGTMFLSFAEIIKLLDAIKRK